MAPFLAGRGNGAPISTEHVAKICFDMSNMFFRKVLQKYRLFFLPFL